MKPKKPAIALLFAIALGGCSTQTGQIGEPIANSYQTQLSEIRIGKTTVPELKRIFPKASLREKGNGFEIWEVAKPGDLDVGAFILWGNVAHNKDQALFFRFEEGKLVSYKSAVTN